MDRKLWEKVKPGDWLIYANEFEGVFKAKVTVVDIRIYTPGDPSVWGYPYGLTKDTGTLTMEYAGKERIENLANLIVWSSVKFLALGKAWQRWQTQKATAKGLRDLFVEMIQEYR